MSPTGAICNLVESQRRVRRKCPYHKHLCYGLEQVSYDTIRVFFDCGTFADYGYGYWEKPKRKGRKS